MGIFANILEKLGIGTAHAHALPDVRPYGPKTVPPGAAGTPGAPAASTPAATPAPVAISEVDVEAQLEKLAASHSEKLNWRTSIVDLMKLLGMDSSLAERKALATELHAPADVMADSAHMNIWLHKQVMKGVAANGGKVPASMLD